MKHYLLILALLTAAATAPAHLLNAQVTSAVKTKLFSISPGETPVYSECQLLMSSSGNSVSLVTKDDADKFYVYENGKKRGPFEDTKNIEKRKEDDNEMMGGSNIGDDSPSDQEGIVTTNDEGKFLINSGGKAYGPFQMVLSLYTDNDRKLIAAITSENLKPSLLTQAGTLISLEKIPSRTYVSPSRKKVIFYTVKEYDPSLDLSKIDASKLSNDEFNKLAQQIQDKITNDHPEAYMYTNEGKKFGPYPKDAMYPTFCITGGDNWMMTFENKFYVNGTFLANMSNEDAGSNIWLSPDGKRFVIISYDKITFSDGSSFTFPLLVRREQKDGKTWINWVSFENGKDIILYSKPF